MKLPMSLAIMGAFIPMSILGAWPHFDIKKLELNYNDPIGHGRADSLVWEKDVSVQENKKFEVERRGRSFYLKTFDEEFVWDDLPAKIEEAKSIKAQGIQLTTDQNKKLNLTIAHLDLKGEKENLFIQALSGHCLKNRKFLSANEALLDACLTNTQLIFKKIFFSENKIAFIHSFFAGVFPQITTLGQTTILEKGQFKIVKGKLKGEFDFRGDLNVGVRLWGHSQYNSVEKTIIVRLDKVKASFLNITKKVFAELEKNESETFIVQRPFIYIKLKDQIK